MIKENRFWRVVGFECNDGHDYENSISECKKFSDAQKDFEKLIISPEELYSKVELQEVVVLKRYT